MASVGIIANPQSGKDIRRLVALASSFSNNEKVLILRRVMAGLASVGRRPDMDVQRPRLIWEPSRWMAFAVTAGPQERNLFDVDGERRDERLHEGRRGNSMRWASGASSFSGGDGTCRAVAKGCGDHLPDSPVDRNEQRPFPSRGRGRWLAWPPGCMRFARAPMEARKRRRSSCTSASERIRKAHWWTSPSSGNPSPVPARFGTWSGWRRWH